MVLSFKVMVVLVVWPLHLAFLDRFCTISSWCITSWKDLNPPSQCFYRRLDENGNLELCSFICTGVPVGLLIHHITNWVACVDIFISYLYITLCGLCLQVIYHWKINFIAEWGTRVRGKLENEREGPTDQFWTRNTFDWAWRWPGHKTVNCSPAFIHSHSTVM